MKRPKVTDYCETIYRAENYKYIQAMEKYIDYLESEANICNLPVVVKEERSRTTVICPECSSNNFYTGRRGYRCRNCKHIWDK